MKRHGLAPVRLCDVPLAKRQAAANYLVKYGNIDKGDELLLAVLFPSDRVHWLPRHVVEAVLPTEAAA